MKAPRVAALGASPERQAQNVNREDSKADRQSHAGSDWLTSREFAALIKVTPRTLAKYRAQGRIEPAGETPGGHPRYLAEQANELLRSRRKSEHKSPTSALVADVLSRVERRA